MLSKTKCRLGVNRETSPWKDEPLNFDSLITASKWTSCNAEWQNKISSLCLNTVAGYSEEAPSILWVYHSYAYQYLLALVALISRWIQNFHLSTEWDCFSPKKGQTFFFKSFRKRFKTKSYMSTAKLTNIHSAVEMCTPRHLDTNDQILNTAHDFFFFIYFCLTDIY